MYSHFIHGKQLVWVVLSTFFTPLLSFMEAYVFDDWEFLKFLMILMVIDTMLGFVKYLQLKEISSRAFAKIFVKITLYFSVLILTHVLTHYKVNGAVNVFFGWFDDFTYAALIVREAISILENMGVLFPNVIPKRLLQKLREFDSNGNPKNKVK